MIENKGFERLNTIKDLTFRKRKNVSLIVYFVFFSIYLVYTARLYQNIFKTRKKITSLTQTLIHTPLFILHAYMPQ